MFVGSSLKGVIEDEPKYAAQLERILQHAKDRCQCRFLLTHLFYSKFREDQEESPPGGIAIEILHAIAWLEQRGVDRTNIRLYKGTPTRFMIASTERMLINPYPYQKQAFRSFCLELENVKSGKGIYDLFWTNHYHKPWFGVEERRDHIARPKRSTTCTRHWKVRCPCLKSVKMPEDCTRISLLSMTQGLFTSQ